MLKTIGFLPYHDPYNRKVRACFTIAGFKRIKLQLNKDRSMMTFWLGREIAPPLRTSRQAHALLRHLLREAGIKLARDDIHVSFRADTICGAFVPPEFIPIPPG